MQTDQTDRVKANQGMIRSVLNWRVLCSFKEFKFKLKQTNKNNVQATQSLTVASSQPP